MQFLQVILIPAVYILLGEVRKISMGQKAQIALMKVVLSLLETKTNAQLIKVMPTHG